MRVRRAIIFLVLLVCIAGVFFIAPHLTQYSRFRHKSYDYYAELTKACDALLVQHPVGTNQFIEISGADPSLPKIVVDLQPLKIKIQSQRVWILHGGSIEFGVSWEQDENRTNVWTLSSACESHVQVLYVASR